MGGRERGFDWAIRVQLERNSGEIRGGRLVLPFESTSHECEESGEREPERRE